MTGAAHDHCPVCDGASEGTFPALYGRRPTVAGVPVTLPATPVIRRCGTCGARWVDPPPTRDALAACYGAAGAAVWHDDPETATKRRYAHRWQRLVRLAPVPAALEIGCYTGGFLAGLPPHWTRVGVEPSTAAAERARERGVEVLVGTLDAVTVPNRAFGAAVAFDVLEHLTDPHGFAARLHAALAPDGVLLIETGDADSRFARRAGRFWSYYHLPEHVVFYTAQAVTTLLERAGFRVLEIERNRHHKTPDALLHTRRIVTAATYAGLSGLWETVARHPAPLRRWQPPWLVHRDHMLVWAQRR
jgi:SAM-dependent methyltransferase